MITERIKKLKKSFNQFGIDGYVIPKNDEFFSEYAQNNRLQLISNFTGSAGYAVILKKKNFLFVDGRYTIQAGIESGKNFTIVNYQKIFNCSLFKGSILGIDPKLFTSKQVKKFFKKNNKVKEINLNLIDNISNKLKLKTKPFFSLKNEVVGESHDSKLKRVSNFLKRNKSNYLFVSAPENVAWLLNIRGFDNPNSPIPNCRILMDYKKRVYFIADNNKTKKIVKDKKIKKNQIIEPKNFENLINKLKKGRIIIDNHSCSIFYENLIKKKFLISKTNDPIYLMKSIKNQKEINNMIKSHIFDGVALTKFLYWIKVVNKKKITEYDAQKKLEKFRKKNNNYLFPSFNTIAGSGKNAAIVHYRATKKKTKKINRNDIFLCDSGGQYKYGTTDVTRTICFSKPSNYIKNIFTRVLKGHIAVVEANLKKYFNGKLVDTLARKYLNQIGLNYEHGTGHGVGFFLNVHEGPHSISKYNKINFREGMVVSNEPGYYKKGKFGIRIENLIYVKKSKQKLSFENLTLAPIEKDLINFKQLTNSEKNYLFNYNLDIYSKISKFLNKNERKWLASFI